MRKLKLQVQTAVNGYTVEPNGEMAWKITDWDDARRNDKEHSK